MRDHAPGAAATEGAVLADDASRQIILRPYRRAMSRGRFVLLVALVALFGFVYGAGFAFAGQTFLVQFAFPLGILGALAVWALPELGAAPTRTLAFLLFAFFVGLWWPNYLAIALPGLPWITIVRLTGFPLSFILLVAVSSSQAFRADMAQQLKATPFTWRLLTGFAIYQCLSLGLSNAPQLSVNKLLVAQISWTAVYFASVAVFSKPGRAERWAFMIWIAAMIESVLAAWEFRLEHPPWAGHIPSFLAVADDSVQRSLTGVVRAGSDRYRVQGSYSTSLGLAEFMALSTPFALHFIADKYRVVRRLAAVVSLPIILYTIILTDSRLGMIGFMLSILLYLLMWGALRWRSDPRSFIGPAVVISYPILFCGFIAASFAIPRLRVITWGGGKQASSTEARVEQVRRGLPMILTHPFGHGIGRGTEALGFLNPSGILTIDTYYLLIGLDYGVFGFALFYGMIILAGVESFQGILIGPKEREQSLLMPITVCLICFFIIKSIYSGVENQPLIYMMFGIITALCARIKAASPTVKSKAAAA
ncbi:MAG TPA: O-antigen ligase family protein [Phenylobacterium sp.]|uniref:O-antigen ligase family protein n=1 Tax=Phenylobacterium sp. TaxID=1871053 RepID=UPI002D294606|nr:O-antigen ligase family protein [Phenylobacterium sp.]HZZ69127.1 O-antigen ligase family protein [Phenylobacterium sp.]